jgi:hypothetical protein
VAWKARKAVKSRTAAVVIGFDGAGVPLGVKVGLLEKCDNRDKKSNFCFWLFFADFF